MSVNLNDLDPMSAEYEAAMEARQDAEDAEREGASSADTEAQPEQDTAETEAPAAVVKADASTDAEPQATKGATEQAAEKVAGVASKDGSRVLPYAALQAERRAARQERGARERIEVELAATRQQLEDLKSGKTKASESDADELSPDELKQLEEFPVIAKMARALKATKELLAVAQKAAPQAREVAETDPAETVQEAIDQVPMLSEWQAVDPVKFARAVEIDSVMRNSPKWAGKPMEARFAHVVKQVADEYDIQIEEPTPRSTSTTEKASAAIANAKRASPNTLSDFKGGQVEQTTERIENMSATKAFDRMSKMTDAEIDEHLAKFG